MQSPLQCESGGCKNAAVTDHKDGGMVWFVCRDCSDELEAGKQERARRVVQAAIKRHGARPLFSR